MSGWGGGLYPQWNLPCKHSLQPPKTPTRELFREVLAESSLGAFRRIFKGRRFCPGLFVDADDPDRRGPMVVSVPVAQYTSVEFKCERVCVWTSVVVCVSLWSEIYGRGLCSHPLSSCSPSESFFVVCE